MKQNNKDKARATLGSLGPTAQRTFNKKPANSIQFKTLTLQLTNNHLHHDILHNST